MAIHPRESDLVIATHGRGIYVIDDITPLRQITPEVLASKVKVLNSLPGKIRMPAMQQEFTSGDEFAGSNSPEAAYITYYLRERQLTGDFKIQIFDSQNRLTATLPAGTRRGLNRVQWVMRMKPPRVPAGQSLETGSLFGPVVPEGEYTAKLLKGDEVYAAQIRLVSDPMLSHSAQDRRLHHETVQKLYTMLEKLATIAASLGEVREQAQLRLNSLKPEDAAYTATKASLDSLDELNKTLAASKEGGGLGTITGEIRLREEIGELYGDISRYGGRPTQSQIDRTAVLESQVESTERKARSLISGIKP